MDSRTFVSGWVETWRCGDCGATYPKTVTRCRYPFDDYLALRGGTVESAILRAVERAIAPRVARVERYLRVGAPIPTTFALAA